MKRIVLLALMLFHLETAHAMFTGNDLLVSCSLANEEALSPSSTRTLQTEDYVQIMKCIAFVQGSALTYGKFLELGLRPPFSLPDELSNNGQIVRIYVKYLQDNPNELHLDGAELLYKSLKEAFPP